jgi:hypothetical protein
MLFELREEQIKRLSNGVIEVTERRIATRNETEIDSRFIDMKVGYRRNINKDEDYSGERIHSVVRVK